MEKHTESALWRWMWLSIFLQLCIAPALSQKNIDMKFTLKSICANAAILSWDAVPNAVNYLVTYGESGNPDKQVTTYLTTTTITGLTPNVNYEFNLLADTKDHVFYSGGKIHGRTDASVSCKGTSSSASMMVVSVLLGVQVVLFAM